MDEFQLNLFFTRSKKKNYFNDQSGMRKFFESNRLYKNVYKGTFAMGEFDHIDMVSSEKCLIVFNSITRNMSTMGHWLALYSVRSKDGMLHVTFFDSFGMNISHYNPILKNYLKKHSPYIKKLDFITYPPNPLILMFVGHMYVSCLKSWYQVFISIKYARFILKRIIENLTMP